MPSRNKEVLRAKARRRYERNKDKMLAVNKKYRTENKEHLHSVRKARRRGIKARAVEHFGNHCLDCGETYPHPCYEFHHLDPDTKDPRFGKLMKNSWEKALPELLKCVMLCANCHRIRHYEALNAPTVS